MEAQDHQKLNHSGSGEHGAVHVCHTCGWPFPNAHPSSRHRRAHKRVCGTVEGYRLDNVSQDKEASDGERNSDDEIKTPSDKVIERGISRRSSSGVGSRSSRSTRSEDDTFTDAVTEFNESPATVVEEAHVSHEIQRFYSMQPELDDVKPAEANPTVDDVCAPVILEDKPPTVPKLEVKKDVEDVASQDYAVTSASLDSAVATLENENALDQYMKPTSQLSSELDIVSEREIEIMLSKNAELRASYSDTNENVAGDVSFAYDAIDAQKATGDELVGSVSASGLVKPTLSEGDDVEDLTEKVNNLDSPGKHEIEAGKDTDSSGNFHSPSLKVYASGDGNSSKSEMIEDCDYEISQACTVEACTVEGGSDAFKKTDGDRVFSDKIVLQNVYPTDDNPKLEARQKSAVEQLISKETTSLPDPKVPVGDINQLKSEVVQHLESENVGDASDSHDQKPAASLENVFPQGAITANIQETSSNEDVVASSSIVKNDAEHVSTHKNEGTMVSEDASAVSVSVLAMSVDDEVPLRAEEAVVTDQSSGMDDNENMKVGDTVLGGKGSRSGGGLENESTDTETGPANGLIPHDCKPKESGRTADHSQLNMTMNSGDMMADHFQGESVLASQCVGEIQKNCENEFHEESIVDMGTTAVLKTDDHLDSTSRVEMIKDAESSCQSSATVDHNPCEKLTEITSCNTRDDAVTDQPVVLPVVETVVDSGSQTDSLDGNWGSASVKSATSDALPATDSLAFNNSQEKGLDLELKPVLENEHSHNEIPVGPVDGIEQIEHTSEIQTTNEEQQITSALQTGQSAAVSHVENEAYKGKKEKEIIAKVTNWDSGKQHTPLKTLLGEATAKSRAESPIHYSQSSTSMPQNDDVPITDNGFSAKSENVVLSFSKPETEDHQEEIGKEWNSPARYHTNIKSEKRKGKPLWAPFLCCSSVNSR